jgi:hypothetical protein
MFLRTLFILASLYATQADAMGLGDYNMVKTLDGAVASCATARDVGRRAYLPIQSLVVSDGRQLQVDILVRALVCQDRSLARDWVSGLFMESYDSRDLSGRPIRHVARYQDLLLVDANSNILAQQELGRQPEAMLSASVTLSSILDGADYRALAEGQTIRKRLDFFLRSQFDVETAEGIVPSGLIAGGTYSLMLEFRRDTNGGMIGVKVLN